MKQSIRRLTALILAMALSLSLLSVNVWAAELTPTEDGVLIVQSGEKLQGDDQSEVEEDADKAG